MDNEQAKASELVTILNTLCSRLERGMESLIEKGALQAFWLTADEYVVEKAARLFDELGCRPDAKHLRSQYRDWFFHYNSWFGIHTDAALPWRNPISLPLPEASDAEMRETRMMLLTGKTRIFSDSVALHRNHANLLFLRVQIVKANAVALLEVPSDGSVVAGKPRGAWTLERFREACGNLEWTTARQIGQAIGKNVDSWLARHSNEQSRRPIDDPGKGAKWSYNVRYVYQQMKDTSYLQ